MRRLHPATILINLFDFIRQFIWGVIVLALSSRREGMGAEIALGALGGLGVLSSVYRYMVLSYGIEAGALIVRRAGIWKQVRTIPLDRVQNVTIKRTFIERLVGVCSVMVETAAGLQAEAQLSSLSESDAEELRARLLSVVSTEKGPSFDLPPALYMLTTRELITAGALQNRALLMLASILGLVQFGALGDSVVDWVKEGHSLDFNPVTWVLIGLGFFLVGWGASIVATALKFGNYRIDRYEKGLRMHYGMLNQTEVLLPLKRVQALTINRPLLFRWFGFAEVRADAMGSFEEKLPTGGVLLSPIVHESRVNKLVGFVYPGHQATDLPWRPVSRRVVLRYFISHVLGWFLPCAAMSLPFLLTQRLLKKAASKLPPIPVVPVWAWFVAGGVILLWAYIYARLRYKYSGWHLDDKFVYSKSGVFRQSVELVPRDNIQWSEVASTWFMRRVDIAVVGVTTATRINHLPPIDRAEADWLLGELTQSEKPKEPPTAIIGG